LGKRTEYVERVSAHMVEWDSQIDLIKDKGINITPETRFEYSEAVEALQRKRDKVTVKLHGISFASDDEWEDLKTGTNNVLDEVRTMFHETIVKIL
jgi:hypothetical protein